MNWQAPGDFLINLLFQLFNLQGEYYVLGLFWRFTEVISVFRKRNAANILIDYLIFFTEFGI